MNAWVISTTKKWWSAKHLGWNSQKMIEFLPTIPLVIPLYVQEILPWLDHWLDLVHYMNHLPKTGTHSLYLWLLVQMNARIYTNETCTLIDYTQSTICTGCRAFPYVGYHTITDHIRFDMMECVTMQLHIMFKCVTMQSQIAFECVTMQSHITVECVNA